MSFSNADLPGCAVSSNNSGQADSVISTCTALSGTSQARLVNHYSPMYDKAFERSTLNSGTYIDEELSELLLDDRRRGVPNHITADKSLKWYMLERLKCGVLMRE